VQHTVQNKIQIQGLGL